MLVNADSDAQYEFTYNITTAMAVTAFKADVLVCSDWFDGEDLTTVVIDPKDLPYRYNVSDMSHKVRDCFLNEFEITT